MRIVSLLVVALLLAASGIAAADSGTVHSSNRVGSPMASPASHQTYFYARNTVYLNNGSVLNGSVNGYSDIPGPAALLYSNYTDTLYAASNLSSIYSIHPGTFSYRGNSSFGSFPAALSFVKKYDSLFILPGQDNMTWLNLSSGVSINISVGYYPQSLAYYQPGNTMFVTVQSPNTLVAVNLSSGGVEYRIPLRFGPFGIAYDHSNGYMYFSYPDSGIVSVFNPSDRAFVANLTLGGSPYQFALNPSGGIVYVTNQGLDLLDVINATTSSEMSRISVGYSPSGIVYDGSAGYLFVANTDSSNVSVVSASAGRTVQTIAVGSQPYSVAFNGNSGNVIVGNHGSDSLSVISPVLENYVVFNETGLQKDHRWHVTVNGHTRYTDSGSVTFDLPNGAVKYNVSEVNGYYISGAGNLNVQGTTYINIEYHSIAALHNEIIAFSVLAVLVALIAGIWLIRRRRK